MSGPSRTKQMGKPPAEDEMENTRQGLRRVSEGGLKPEGVAEKHFGACLPGVERKTSRVLAS